MPSAYQLAYEADQVDGYWIQQGNPIVLAGSAQFNGPVVRHEMLHALVGAGHSREQFLHRCGGVVACEDICLRDAGPPPASGPQVVEVTPDSLEIATVSTPALPS